MITWTDGPRTAIDYARKIETIDRVLRIRRALREARIDLPAQYEAQLSDPRRI